MTQPAAAIDTPYGRRYQLTIDGEKHSMPSAGTIMGVLDKPGLNTWKLKRVATAIALDEPLRSLAAIEPYQAVRACLDSESPEAALGTAVHAATASVDEGLPVDWDNMDPAVDRAEVEAHLAQWALCKAAHGLVIVEMERTVFNRTYHYAGTLDRLLVVPALGEGIMVGDIKTGRAVWPDVALQLAAYANAEGGWDSDRHCPLPLPVVDRTTAVAIALHADRYELVPVGIEAAWLAFLAAADCWDWANVTSRRALQPPLRPPAPEPEPEWPW